MVSYFFNIFEAGIHKMSDSVSVKSCENLRNVKKNLAEKIMIWIVLFFKTGSTYSQDSCQALQSSFAKLSRQVLITLIILHSTYYLSSHWLRAYSKFWKYAQPTD